MFGVYVAIQDVGGFIRTLRTFSFRKHFIKTKVAGCKELQTE